MNTKIFSLYKLILIIITIGFIYSFSTDIIEHDRCEHKRYDTVDLVSHSPNSFYFYDSIFYFNPEYKADGFDFAVGKPNAENYYLASRFGNRNHLGEDWNGKGGGNTDLGDPVYAAANGLVTVAEDICCGWGNVVRVVHKLEGHPDYNYLETVYAHLDKINVAKGQFLTKGQMLGTIGTAHGTYTAHLHLELRDFIDMSMGPGYSDDWEGYLDPSEFIRNNRHF